MFRAMPAFPTRLDKFPSNVHFLLRRTKDMPKKNSATISRSAISGKFTIRKDGGDASVHASSKKTPKTVSTSISKNRDALKRLANR